MANKFKKGDFVKLEFDIYANSKLVQTTDEKKAKENNIQISKAGPQTIILGKGFVLEAVEKNIYENQKDKDKLSLKAEDAYGKRDKKLIKTFSEKVFAEQKLRPVVGIVYDFGGMFGTVKAVSRGRVMVDFNNPLAGKDIEFDYKVVETIEKDEEKLKEVFVEVLKLPETMYKIENKGEKIEISVPKELVVMKDHLLKTIKDLMENLDEKKLEFKELEIKKKSEKSKDIGKKDSSKEEKEE
jgi:FKBP-type peptidyl-prolyl cis-trans isomerase 2